MSKSCGVAPRQVNHLRVIYIYVCMCRDLSFLAVALPRCWKTACRLFDTVCVVSLEIGMSHDVAKTPKIIKKYSILRDMQKPKLQSFMILWYYDSIVYIMFWYDIYLLLQLNLKSTVTWFVQRQDCRINAIKAFLVGFPDFHWQQVMIFEALLQLVLTACFF